MGLGMPIPDLSNKPGPGRPGYPTGAFEFKLEIEGTGAFTFTGSKAGGGQNFSIDWGDGTSASGLTGASHTHTYSTAGPHVLMINNEEDSGPINVFQITAGETLVTKVLNWGTTAWNNLTAAFSGCTNLTTLEDSALITDSNGDLYDCFNGCTGLTTVNGKKWNLSAGARIGRWFNGCTNVELLDLTGVSLNLIEASDDAFQSTGSATTNGCEFKLSGITLTQPSSLSHDDWFRSTKIKPTSTFANITWPSNYFNGLNWFYEAVVTGTNSTLNCSGWSTFDGTLSGWFSRLNNVGGGLTPSNTNLKIDLTNFSGKTASINGLVSFSAVSGLIGLSTWGATDLTPIDFSMAFYAARVFAMDANDNFSNTFISSCNVSGISNFYRQTGNDYNGTLVYGAAPNLSNLDCSSVASFARLFEGAKLTSNPDFNSITYPSTAVSFNSAFSEIRFQTYSGSHIDFSNATLKISDLGSAFRGYGTSVVEKLTFGNNVDFSQLTSFSSTFYNFGRGVGGTEITLPTNADYGALTSVSNMFFNTNFPYTIPALNNCQVNYFIRNLYSSRQSLGSGGAFTINMPGMSITEAPSLVRSTLDDLTALGYNITLGATDTPLPFAYASYAVDPTGVTTISPTTTPQAGSVFTATNSLSINSSTGVITPGSFRGGSTIRCTYPDGCYNEVVMLIQVPFTMNITIPSGSTNFELKPQMSAGECFVDWGDNSSQILTANTTHSYASSGSDQTYPVKIFDSPSGSKFTGFNSSWSATSGGYIDDIAQWGEIEWQNNSWFANTSKSTITATDTPNLSQVTSLQQMFSSNGINSTFSGGSAISNWDVSTITNMSSMFWKVGSANFTQNLSNWDVSNVTTLQRFNYTYPEYLSYNQNWVADWGNKTSNVEDFSYFMYGGKNNSIAVNSNMGNYNTSSATNMTYMFFNNGGDIANCKTKIVNAGQADEYIAWDVKKVENFSYMFAGGFGRFVSTEFPDNWYISGDSQDINMQNMFGWFYGSGSLNNITDLNSFATKTISAGTSPYGTQYTAWNMSNTTNLIGFAQGNNANQLNWNINTWQISNKLTRFDSLLNTRSTNINWTYTLDQDLGHWDISNVTNATNSWFNNYTANPIPAGFSVNFSTANYDSLLSITDGWGQHASSAQSGVTVNFGTSKYSPGNALAVSRGNVSNPAGIPSGQMFVYDANVVLKDLTSVGDIVQLMNGGSTYGEFAKITGYLATDDRVAFVDVLGGASFPINWPGITWQYQIYDSDAAKGRYALLEAGWTITDGGVDIPFESAEIEIELAPGQENMSLITLGLNTKIDWGDGNGFINNPSTGQPYTGTYAFFTYPTVAAGTTDIYRIKVRESETETFGGWRFGFGYQYGSAYSGGLRVRKIITWGSHKTQDYSQAFQGADLNKAGFTNTLPVDANGKIVKPTWITSITSFSQAFKQANLPANADFSNWATGLAATNLNSMFTGNTNFIGTGLANWNVTKVTNINSFLSSTAFNSDISGWDLQSCIYASGLFSNTPFNHPSISNLNLHNISNIHSMFLGCTAFNQDVNTKVVGTGADAYLAWDTDPVTVMFGCFKGCSSFNYSIDKWNIGQLDAFSALASFFYGVGSNLTNGYTHDLLTKDVTVGAGTPAAKTYVAWDVGQVNGFGGTSQNYTTTQGMFQNSKFNGDISNWDMSGLGAQGGHAYSSAGQWGRVFYNNPMFNQDISSKTITNVSGKGTYTAWDMSNWTAGRYAFFISSSFNQNLGNWTLSTTDTSSGDMLGFFGNSNMSTANYTDSFTGWANTAKTNNGFPKNKGFGRQYNRTFDTTRTNGITAFTVNTAGRARSYLTLDVTISGGASSVNGVYYYNYETSKWVKETDANATIEWNSDESSWDVSYEGEVQHNGTGGSQTAGPESSTSWSGGISVVDSSLGWSISDDTITT